MNVKMLSPGTLHFRFPKETEIFIHKLIETDDYYYYFVASFNMIMEDSSNCVAQSLYAGTVGNGYIDLQLAEDQNGNIGYYYCQNANYSLGVMPVSGTIQDNNSIDVQSDNGCAELILQRGD